MKKIAIESLKNRLSITSERQKRQVSRCPSIDYKKYIIL